MSCWKLKKFFSHFSFIFYFIYDIIQKKEITPKFMSIEQPRFENAPNLNNPELNPNKPEGGVNIEKSAETKPEPEKIKEQGKTSKRADFKKDKDITSEEVNEMFETLEKKYKLEETLKKWIEETGADLRQRAERLGLKESVVEEIQKNLERSFEKDLRTVNTSESLEKLKENSSKTIANLIETEQEDKPILKNLLDRLSKKDIFDLLDRKLKGEATPEEEKILDTFSYTDTGKKILGTHDIFSGEIEIFLLNPEDLKKYNATLGHEFTHKALSNLMPEKVREKMISLRFIKTFEEEFRKTSGEKIEKTPAEKAQRWFFHILLAINESLAHRAEKYYGAKREPSYLAYRDKIHPGIFKDLYSQVDAAVTGKPLAEFDHFAAHIYSFFVNKWSENLSPEDVNEAAISVIKEIKKFKGK